MPRDTHERRVTQWPGQNLSHETLPKSSSNLPHRRASGDDDVSPLRLERSFPGRQSPQTRRSRGPNDPYYLVQAASSGNMDAVLKELEHGTPINSAASQYEQDLAGDTALHQAAARDNVTLTNLLLERDADIEARDALDRTPLIRAILGGAVNTAKMLMQKGASITHRAQGVVTPLVAAIQVPDPNILSILVENGVNLRTVSGPEQGNALHWAAAGGYVNAVRFLCQHISIESKDRRQRTPLIVSSEAGNSEVVEVLLNAGAQIDAKSDKGGSALAWAATHGHVEVMKLLIRHGADLNSVDQFGHSVLFLAANFGRLSAVQLLLENGAVTDIRSAPPEGLTALHAAASEGHVAVVEMLLQHGVDSTIETFKGQTALDIAIEDRQEQVLRIFLHRLGEPTKDSVSMRMALASGHEMLKAIVRVTALCFMSLSSYTSDRKPSLTTAATTATGPPSILLTPPANQELAWVHWVLTNAGSFIKRKASDRLLQYALADRDLELLKTLVAEGANLDAVLDQNLTPLSFAIKTADIQTMLFLLDAGVDPNGQSSKSASPLHEAITLLEHDPAGFEIIQILLAHNIQILSGDAPESNPLSRVYELGFDALAHQMLESTLDLNKDKDKSGASILHTIVYRDRIEEIDYLLERGASLEAVDNEGLTPLALSLFSTPMMNILLDKGANPDVVTKVGCNLLHEAAACDNEEALKRLVTYGLNLDKQDQNGSTPLHAALASYSETSALYLISQGADVSIKQKSGRTALHIACQNNADTTVVKSLIEHGADVLEVDNEGQSALHEASASASAVHVRLLLDNGAEVDKQASNHNRPLHMAIANDQQEIAMMLILAGASHDLPGETDHTPLHVAAMRDLLEISRILLEMGANKAAKNDDGCTPLHLACYGGNTSVADLLIRSNADTNALDYNGWTPLHYAADRGHIAESDMLLQAGADFLIRTLDDGLTARERAEDQGFESLVKILLDWEAAAHEMSSRTASGTGPAPLLSSRFSADTEFLPLSGKS
jgi:ankyrin repeat protein